MHGNIKIRVYFWCSRCGEITRRVQSCCVIQFTYAKIPDAQASAAAQQEYAHDLQVAFPDGATKEVSIGASVALNGTCLTVTSIDQDTLSFDVIPETLKRTNLGVLDKGSSVNFERSVRYGDEVGGHNVSGHVHTTAEIVQLEQRNENSVLKFKVSDLSWMKYIMTKGFIAVDGCSLTVGEVCNLLRILLQYLAQKHPTMMRPVAHSQCVILHGNNMLAIITRFHNQSIVVSMHGRGN